jgi:S1-C subfamily serine protease
LVGTDQKYAIIGYTTIDAKRDMAILKVRAFGVKSLSLGNSENIKINDNVYAVGNPLVRSYLEGTVSYGKISGIREDSSGKWIQMTAPISPGNSGGPVLNSLGKVVGISTLVSVDDEKIKYDVKDSKDEKKKIGFVELPRRAEQNLNFAIHVDDLKTLLKRVGPPKPLSNLEITY